MSTAELLAAKGPTPDSWWSWARVDSLAPLRVVLDGETVALAITPEDHVGGLVVGNRVRMHFHYGRAYVTSKAGGPVSASNPNLIINGRGRINQRGYVSGTSLTAGQYCLDRFKANNAGMTVTFTAAPQGQPMTVSAGGYLAHVIERANLRSGTNTATISWEGNAKVILTGPQLSSPIVTTVDGAADFTLYIGNGAFDKLKVEYGSAPTLYEDVDYGSELAQCKRYGQLLYSGVGSAYLSGAVYYSATHVLLPISLPVEMRAAPTAIVAGSYILIRAGASNSLSSLYLATATTRQIALANATEASGTAGDSGMIYGSPAARIFLDAEL